jgi:hypothetical protein
VNVLAALDWTDPATIGYPALGVGVLLGSIVPIVDGAVVGAAAIAMTTGGSGCRRDRPSTVAALAGDPSRSQRAARAASRAAGGAGPDPELAAMRERFAAHGGRLVVVERRSRRAASVLLAAALSLPVARLVPAAPSAASVGNRTAVLGVVGGGIFTTRSCHAHRHRARARARGRSALVLRQRREGRWSRRPGRRARAAGWLVSVLALRLLDAWLPRFAMPQ